MALRIKSSSITWMRRSLKWLIGILLTFSLWLNWSAEFQSHQQLLVTTSSSFRPSTPHGSSSSPALAKQIKETAADIILPLENSNDKGKSDDETKIDNQINIHNSSFIRDVSTEKITTKPYFVFHIGIPKSGTTTIQCGLSKLSGELVSQDSYYYIGKPCSWVRMENGEKPIQGAYLMLELNRWKYNQAMQDLNATLNRLLHPQDERYTNGVVLSSESFCSTHWKNKQRSYDALKGLLEGYSVRIVIGYRRYFEWMPSLFYQHNHRKPLAQSYVEYIRTKLNTTMSHMTTDATRKWNAQFEDVYVFNIHQEGELTTNFVCQVLPGPPTNVCRKEKFLESRAAPNTASQNKTRHLMSQDIDWYRLVAAIKQLGWNVSKPDYKSIKWLYDTFKTTHREEYQSLQSCLTVEDQERLLNLSLAMEEELVATATATGNNKHLKQLLLPSSLEDHRKKFYDYVSKGRYCQLDAIRALSNTSSSFVRFALPQFADT